MLKLHGILFLIELDAQNNIFNNISMFVYMRKPYFDKVLRMEMLIYFTLSPPMTLLLKKRFYVFRKIAT